MAGNKQFANKVRRVVRNVENQRAKLQEIVVEAATHFVEHNNTEKLTVLIHELEPEQRWMAAMNTYITAFLAVRWDKKNSQYKAKKNAQSNFEGMQQVRWDEYANEKGTGHVKGFEPVNDVKSKYRSLVKAAHQARISAENQGDQADPMTKMLETVYAAQAADLATILKHKDMDAPQVKDKETGEILVPYKAEDGRHYIQSAPESAAVASGSK